MMSFTKEDQKRLQKIDVDDLLSLLLYLPKSYDNNFLSDALILETQVVIEVLVRGKHLTPSQLQFDLHATAFNQAVRGVIFKPQSFHHNMLTVGERYTLKGKLSEFNGILQIIQPKVVTDLDEIKPLYKAPIRNLTISKLVEKHLTHNVLKAFNLSDKTISILLELHHPIKNTLRNYVTKEGYSYEASNHIKLVEIYRYLKLLKERTHHFPSLFQSTLDPEAFVAALPFTLTNDQANVISVIRKDLASPIQSRRVVIGDVGCGKTIVMLATAFMVFPHKAIIMAPTTILANQLIEEAHKFLPTSYKIHLVTNKSKTSDQEILEADLLIGTHALLYHELPKVSVIMVDEQHRFGSNQRHALSILTSDAQKLPHFFQFSATPIPRTQAMIESTLADVSFIKEVPFKKDITTSILHKYDFEKLLLHIQSEIDKGNQVLIIYPLVSESESMDYQSLEEALPFWKKRFSNVYATHGKDKEKEQILVEFREKGDILLATTVVEVGISLPRLSTVVISGAERLGLASLHQLKGRVSRTGLKGYCFLVTNVQDSERLDAFTHTNNGFEVAELDLELRKSGDLLSGINQSGEHFRYFDMRSDQAILQKATKLLNQMD
jgi:ATP-dependent DNA helicase RecG